MAKTATARRTEQNVEQPTFEVAIVGAGFGGLGAAIELKKHGIENFVIVEKHGGVGGTWWANTYPGVAVDIPSVYYSFSYEPPRKWTRMFAPGAEVQQYAEQLVDRYDLRRHLVLNTSIVKGEWDEQNDMWRGTLDTGDVLTSRFVIGALGGLEVPKNPDIPGVDTFAGKIVHTARWDHDYDYKDKRIAVIGTGATALQLIPEIADVASHLTVFQRTPIWCAPKPDFPLPPGTATIARFGPLRRAVRAVVAMGIDTGISGAGLFHSRVPFIIDTASDIARLYYKATIRDPELREQLTPQYALGCKRPSVSNRYLQTFTRSHVDLITEPIERITENAVVTADGKHHEIDVLVCATGFKVMERGAAPSFPLAGRGGVDLNEFWHENRYTSYQGASMPGWPNLFMITAPYGFAAGSYIAMIECTARHAARAISEATKRGATYVEVTQDAHDRYVAKCRKRTEDILWLTPSCAGSNTYYVNYQGDPAPLRPSLHAEMWWGNKHFPHKDYVYSSHLPAGARKISHDLSPQKIGEILNSISPELAARISPELKKELTGAVA